MRDLAAQWQLPLEAVACSNCGWDYLVSAETSPLTCPNCFQTTLAPVPSNLPHAPTPAPELIIPFTISDDDIQTAIHKFADSYYLEPRDLTAKNLLARAQRIYLPMWLVDADVAASWHAEVGFDHATTTQNERYANGVWNSYEREEMRTRWEARAGSIEQRYDNVRAPALDEHDELIEPLGMINIWETQLYEAQYVENTLIRVPNRPIDDAWSEALPALLQLTEHTCQQASGGEHIRQFKWQPEFANLHWTQLLIPIVTTYYLDDQGQPVPLILNGRTGHLSGKRCVSHKLARLIALLLALISIVVFGLGIMLLFSSAGRGFALLSIVAFALGGLATVPFFYAASVSEHYSA